MIDPGLKDRVALVTGGNHGIGAATVEALEQQGAKVFVTYLRDYLLQRVGDERFSAPRSQHPDGPSFECDLADPSVIPDVFDRAEHALGPVEILVHNAAASEHDSFETVTAELVDHHFAVNARATALLIAEFARRHRQRGANWGRIVTLTSAGPRGFPGEISYGASKAALESYTYSAAWELQGLGITANVVYPPPTDTGWIPDELRPKLPRVGRPEEVAEVIVFLASEQGHHITGERIRMR